MKRVSEISLPALNGGINAHDPEYAIGDNQSPDMRNLWYRNKALCKRDGQTLSVSLSGVHRISREFEGFYAVHAGTNMYRWDGRSANENKGVLDASGAYPNNPATGDYYVVSVAGTIEGTAYNIGDRALYDGKGWYNTLAEIGSGMQDAQGVFTEFGDKLYYIDGAEIWEISSAYAVTAVVPYAPVVMINCKPDLSESSDNEAYNLIGVGFCVKYHGDGSSTAFTLPKIDGQNLDSTAVTAVVDGVDDKTENTDFTVNRATGVVTFGSAPGTGTNNVWITAYQTVSGSKAKIAGCKVALPFGGESSGTDGGSRVFVMGNADYPLTFWRSDLGVSQSYGMCYFPDTSAELLDQNAEPITAAAKMGGEMIIFKQRSIYAVGYVFDGQDVYYPVRECHSRIGCDMPGSVQLIDNRLVFANTESGVHMLISTGNSDENTVKPLSANINELLLTESNLTGAVSCDFERYYWLRAGGSVYLWDYEGTPYHNYADYEKAQRRLAWYRFDGIDADDFCAGEKLHYAGSSGIVTFKKNKNDFGDAYDAYFISKAFDLEMPQRKKTFYEVVAGFRGDGNVKATVTVGNENTDEYAVRSVDFKSFAWDMFNWSALTWSIIKFTKMVRMLLRMKNVSYVQVRVDGNEADRGVGLTMLRMTYTIGAQIKR